MQENQNSEMSHLPLSSELQQKLSLFYERGFKSKEIALAIGIKKGQLRRIKKGKHQPVDEELNYLLTACNDALKRFKIEEISTQEYFDHIDNEKKMYKLKVKDVTVYKGTDDSQMVVFLSGQIEL